MRYRPNIVVAQPHTHTGAKRKQAESLGERLIDGNAPRSVSIELG